MKDKIEEALSYYESNKVLFELLCKDAIIILQKILEEKNIKYQSIDYRVKKYDSYKKKCEKEKYSNPIDEIRDIAGLRIITYLSSDVNEIDNLIKELFEVDTQNSKDKKDELENDKVGYIAKHYILKYNPDRIKLLENRKFKNMCFELQVKTLLQHAWAEISHDRAYKFNGVLPSEIKRRLNLTAAMLETVDNEFQNISNQINEYRIESEKIYYRNLDRYSETIELTSISLFDYIKANFDFPNIHANIGMIDEDIINAVKAMGYSSLNEFDIAIKGSIYKFIVKYLTHMSTPHTIISLIELSLMSLDPEKYLEKMNIHERRILDEQDYDFISALHPDNNLREYFDVRKPLIPYYMNSGMIFK